MDHSKLVSIILPIYNAESTLDRCLSSLRRQTYDNIEVLMLDDGSDDSSREICSSYARTDSRFKLYALPPSRNVATVRNAGLEMYTGDYLMFADADDLVSDNYVERLLNILIDSGCNIATCIAYDTSDTCLEYYTYHSSRQPREIRLDEYDFTSSWSHRVVWGAIFPRSVIGSTRFDEEYHSSTDTLFMASLLSREEKIVHLDEPLYVYIYYPDSISHKEYDWKRFSDIRVWEDIAYRVFDDGPEVPKNSAGLMLLRRCYRGIRYLALMGNYDNDLMREMLNSFSRYCKDLLPLPGLGRKDQVKYRLLNLAPKTYLKLLHMKHADR